MPLYEYKCASCGKIFELLQKFSDEPVTIHEGCGGATERLISAPAFHLKGSGWYATDYAKTNGTTKPGESKSDSGSAEGKSAESGSAKSESKETKSDGGSTPEPAKSSSSDSKPSPAPAADSK